MAHKYISILVCCAALTGCFGSRGITKPRSELIADADSQGIPVTSPELDREFFFAHEKANQERLITLLRSRVRADGADSSYVIGAGDSLEISVFDVPELNLAARVRGSGSISLPLVGVVQASGRTEAELVEELRGRLRSYVHNPQVTLLVANYGSQKIGVLGAVQKPGSYALRKGANSVTELLSAAGGVTARAGNFLNFIPAEQNPLASSADEVELRARLSLGDTEVQSVARNLGFELYLDQVLGTSGGIPIDLPVRAGDMIIVPEGGKIMVEGEVQSPGSADLGQQMTLLGALAASGGITYAAKVDEVEVVRTIGGREVHLVVDLEQIARGEGRDVRLRNGDIVRVPSDSGRRLRQDTFESITKIFNFGVGSSVPIK